MSRAVWKKGFSVTALSRERKSRETYAESVAADVVRADRQVADLQALDTVDVQALVKNTVLDDRVAALGCHAAGSERVPGGLDMAFHCN
jgi:hypothetical protein